QTRNLGDLLMRIRSEAEQGGLDRLSVFGHQLAFERAQLRAPERVEARAAQPSSFMKCAEQRSCRALELELALHAKRSQQRRVQQDLNPGSVPKLAFEPDALQFVKV